MSSDHRLQRIEKQIEAMHKKQIPSFQPVVPDILEFTTSDAYLGRPGLFPRQATILKLLFLQDALFTDYDLEVISQWTSSFERTGNNGVQPDVLERLRICKAEGRHYFKETLAVIGRRGGKNHLGAIAAAYVTWRFLALGDPQSFYGLDDGQRLSMFVFAGNHLQAKHNQFREIARFIGEARCFKPFLADKTGARLTLYTPKDLELGGAEVRAGSKLWGRQPSIEIVAKESTAISGRGPTAYGELFDEMAHTVASGSNRSAEEIYDAATPALDQFGKDGFLFEPSSPYHSTGKFFENYRRALDVTDDGKPTNPHMLMFQLTSFDPYIDWERAHELPMVPNGPAFQRLERAPQTFDKEMEGLREANPETFEVERLSRFATVRDAYLAENKVAAMFGPWRGSPLLMLSRGVPIHTYWAHCDTSQSNANTALAIGHGEEVDGVVHVVIDRLQLWRPQDFPEHQINYRELEEELWQALVAFTPAELSFDQFQSASLISSLSDRVAKTYSLRGVSVLLKPAHASRNWQRAEGFKTALGMGQIHVPFMDEYGTPYPASELLDLEARFVQNRGGKVRPPTSGPVQTKDVLDALMEVTMAVQDENSDGKVFERLGASFNAPRSPGLRAWAGVDPEIDAQFEELRRGLQRRSDGRSAARGGRLHGGARRPRR